MALTIAIIVVLFVACAIYAYKAKGNIPNFTDEQLLNQHRRFLAELESSRSYIGATYFHSVEKGSPAQAELTLRGYDVTKLLQERASAEREDRPMDWDSCRAQPIARPAGESAEERSG
jgi:hypothetical protein